eukprot:gene32458-33208_t
MTQDLVLDAQKAALRIEARRRRKALQDERPQADWMIAGQADVLVEILRLKPGIVALYKALGAELDPILL